MLKQLTGGDEVTARLLYREAFTFRPTFALWLAANSRPRAAAGDSGLWRRLVQVPFVTVIPEDERDPKVKQTLIADQSARAAVLAWAVRGAIEWQRDGLAIPDSVRSYTQSYRAEQDDVGAFVDERCVLTETSRVKAADLYSAYREWAAETGVAVLSPKAVAARLAERGLTPERTRDARWWRGVSLNGCGPHIDEESLI